MYMFIILFFQLLWTWNVSIAYLFLIVQKKGNVCPRHELKQPGKSACLTPCRLDTREKTVWNSPMWAGFQNQNKNSVYKCRVKQTIRETSMWHQIVVVACSIVLFFVFVWKIWSYKVYPELRLRLSDIRGNSLFSASEHPSMPLALPVMRDPSSDVEPG